jgi:beta-barrel assembly-enhancing protease
MKNDTSVAPRNVCSVLRLLALRLLVLRSLVLACAVAASLFVGEAQPARAGLWSISPDKERRIGEEAAREIESKAPIVKGPVADWVNVIGQRLVAVSNPEFKYSFRVIDNGEINAFALPGGYIYVYTGLRKIARTDDELAAILAHEITHAEEHHYAQQYKKASKRGLGLTILSMAVGLPSVANQVLSIVDFSMTQKYSRTHEFQADEKGAQRMARAGFDPRGMITLLEKLSKESGKSDTLDRWFGSHPDGGRRVEAAKREVAEVEALQARNDPLVRPRFAPWHGDVFLQPVDNSGGTSP